jgi:hypothetical protein
VNIPDEVLKASARKLFSARFGAIPEDIEGDKDFEWAVEDLATAAPIIAEWARREALKEAAEAIENTEGGPQDFWGMDLAADTIRALLEGVTDEQ